MPPAFKTTEEGADEYDVAYDERGTGRRDGLIGQGASGVAMTESRVVILC